MKTISPTVNIDALAYGIPVITYRTWGTPEAVDDETGIVVEIGDVARMAESIRRIGDKGGNYFLEACRKRAEELYDKCFEKYVELYVELYEELLTFK